MLSPCEHPARYLVLSAVGAIVFVAGCATTGADTRHRLDDMEQQLVSAQNRNDRLEERVAALESALESDRGQNQAAAAERPAAEEHGPQLPVVRLRPNVEDPRDGDPVPDLLESESANQPSGDQPTGVRPGSSQGGPKKGSKKSAAPETDKPREVIKVHGDGPQSRLNDVFPCLEYQSAPREVQSTCRV